MELRFHKKIVLLATTEISPDRFELVSGPSEASTKVTKAAQV